MAEEEKEELLGDEMLDGVDTEDEEVQTQPEDKVDTETDTSEDDTDTDTTEEGVDPYTQKFNELNLGGMYRDVHDVLEREPERQRYLTQVQQENAELKRRQAEWERQQQQKEPIEIDPDTFLQNPDETLKKLGYVRGEDVDQRVSMAVDRMRAEEFMRSTPDFEKLRPVMDSIVGEMPELGRLSNTQLVKVAYQLAKTRQAPAKKVVEPADKSKKDRANTSGGKTPTGKKTATPKVNFSTDSLEDIERKVGYNE